MMTTHEANSRGSAGKSPSTSVSFSFKQRSNSSRPRKEVAPSHKEDDKDLVFSFEDGRIHRYIYIVVQNC